MKLNPIGLKGVISFDVSCHPIYAVILWISNDEKTLLCCVTEAINWCFYVSDKIIISLFLFQHYSCCNNSRRGRVSPEGRISTQLCSNRGRGQLNNFPSSPGKESHKVVTCWKICTLSFHCVFNVYSICQWQRITCCINQRVKINKEDFENKVVM